MRFRKFLKPYKTRGSSFREHTLTKEGGAHEDNGSFNITACDFYGSVIHRQS